MLYLKRKNLRIPYWCSRSDVNKDARITIVRGEMSFLGKGSKVDLQYMDMEMGVEDVLGIRVFELRDAILNSEYFDEEFCREFLNTIIEERERKEEIELDERKRKEIELAERKRRWNWLKKKTRDGNSGKKETG
ncbi:hypothetical protein TNCV_2878081 [Trichonephila clavipes]|uniref:Uncharacterized protein n=1 Tax=Trichonephila clavipes TaxID=2585209 RepID=A0A8X7BC17_TRICX|nr:hypothetical protein TNCV_2878081 [Trichonephila clavipes]